MWYKIYNLNIHETMEEAQYKKIWKEITKQIKILQKIIPSYSTTKALKTLLDDPKNLNFISKYEEFKKEYKNKKNIEKRVYIDYCSEMLTKWTEEHKIYLSKISEKRKEYWNEYIKLIANRSDIEKHYIFMFDQIPNSLKSVILCFDENWGEQKLVDILKVHI